MARLPIPGEDAGQWGEILNEYLSQAHGVDGSLKANSIHEEALEPAVRAKLNSGGGIGATGPIGFTGPVGSSGTQGAAGMAGDAGATGVMGSAGPVGATGTIGTTGFTGPIGSVGATGVNGIQGATGAPGVVGPAGSTGIQGATGPVGPSGVSGSIGSTGATGSAVWPGRTTASVDTLNINDGEVWSGMITITKAYRLLAITTDRPARVRVYSTIAKRDADISRLTGTDPIGNHGVLLEFVTVAGVLSSDLSPLVDGASMEAVPTSSIPVNITNMSGETGTVRVTFTYLATETA